MTNRCSARLPFHTTPVPYKPSSVHKRDRLGFWYWFHYPIFFHSSLSYLTRDKFSSRLDVTGDFLYHCDFQKPSDKCFIKLAKWDWELLLVDLLCKVEGSYLAKWLPLSIAFDCLQLLMLSKGSWFVEKLDISRNIIFGQITLIKHGCWLLTTGKTFRVVICWKTRP